MSTGFVVTLALVFLLMLLSRLLVPGLPLRRTATRLTALDFTLATVGLIGLVLHCASMFYRSLVASVPGTADVISQINSMGTASMIWYIVPSLLLMAGLRRQNVVALFVLAVALIAVGVTMYNGTPVPTHVNTIFAAATAIGAITFLLVIPPWQNKTLAAQN